MRNYNHKHTDTRLGSLNNPSDTVYNYVGDGTADTVTIPTGATSVSLSASTDFYVNFNGHTATVPGSDITNGQGHVHVSNVPVTKYLNGITTFSVIGAAGVISIEFFNE